MSRMLLSAGRYIQGAGAVREIGIHAARLGGSALLIGGKTALSLCGPDIEASLAGQGISSRQELFRGVSSRQEISRLAAIAAESGADIVIALGGGAAIDAGKAVAYEMKAPVIVVPTTVASDAPCSSGERPPSPSAAPTLRQALPNKGFPAAVNSSAESHRGRRYRVWRRLPPRTGPISSLPWVAAQQSMRARPWRTR